MPLNAQGVPVNGQYGYNPVNGPLTDEANTNLYGQCQKLGGSMFAYPLTWERGVGYPIFTQCAMAGFENRVKQFLRDKVGAKPIGHNMPTTPAAGASKTIGDVYNILTSQGATFDSFSQALSKANADISEIKDQQDQAPPPSSGPSSGLIIIGIIALLLLVFRKKIF
jgi:hypothetical protein